MCPPQHKPMHMLQIAAQLVNNTSSNSPNVAGTLFRTYNLMSAIMSMMRVPLAILCPGGRGSTPLVSSGSRADLLVFTRVPDVVVSALGNEHSGYDITCHISICHVWPIRAIREKVARCMCVNVPGNLWIQAIPRLPKAIQGYHLQIASRGNLGISFSNCVGSVGIVSPNCLDNLGISSPNCLDRQSGHIISILPRQCADSISKLPRQFRDSQITQAICRLPW